MVTMMKMLDIFNSIREGAGLFTNLLLLVNLLLFVEKKKAAFLNLNSFH